jgi:putative ABC transport system substrate-binding protein
VLFALLAAALAHAAAAAEVALLKSADDPAWRPSVDALRLVAKDHVLSVYDLKNDRVEAERVLTAVKGRAAVLVAFGGLAAQAARESAPGTPLVYCMVLDPSRAGLVGVANTTGVAFAIPVKNQLAAFRMVNPRGVRVGILYNPENSARLVQEAQRAATVVRLSLVERAVFTGREVADALHSLFKKDAGVDAVWIPPDPLLLADDTRRVILQEATKAGKPIYSSLPALVAEGALVSNGPDFTSIGEQAGDLVNRLIEGEKAGSIEVVVPRAELVINKKVADKLKVEIPDDALKLASRVF